MKDLKHLREVLDEPYPREELSLDALARVVAALDGLPPAALDGGWTFKGFTAYVQKIEGERDAFKQSMYAELDSNLRLRELGGAKQDEAMTPFLERVFTERDAMRAALLALVNAADDLGVKHFDSDWLSDAEQTLKDATQAARLALGPNVQGEAHAPRTKL